MRESEPPQEKIPLLSERGQRVKDKISNLYNIISQKEKSELYNQTVSLAKYLEGKYPDARKYEIFHVLIGSTIDSESGQLILDDFPGDDSVEAFIDSLVVKYSI